MGLLYELATMPEHPESVPINALVPIEGASLSPPPDPSPTHHADRLSVFLCPRHIPAPSPLPSRIPSPPFCLPLSPRPDPRPPDPPPFHRHGRHAHDGGRRSARRLSNGAQQPPHETRPGHVQDGPARALQARTIATARVVMPASMVRLSAGRMSFSPLEQAPAPPPTHPLPPLPPNPAPPCRPSTSLPRPRSLDRAPSTSPPL